MKKNVCFCTDPVINNKFRKAICMTFIANRMLRSIPINTYWRIVDVINPNIDSRTTIETIDTEYLGTMRSHLIKSIEAEMLFLDARTEEAPDLAVGWNSISDKKNLMDMEVELENLENIMAEEKGF